MISNSIIKLQTVDVKFTKKRMTITQHYNQHEMI